MGEMQRILIVEDHASFRQTLAFVFDQQPEFRVVAQAGTLVEARRTMDGSEADLGVIDLCLPDGEGTDLIEELRDANPDFAALVLTASLDRTEHARAVEAGAAGVLHKSADVDVILDATRRVGEGETLLSEDELISLLRLAGQNREEELEARASIEQITPREMEVLQIARRGPLEQGDSGRTAHERGYRTHPHDEHLEQARRALPDSGPRSSPPATAS